MLDYCKNLIKLDDLSQRKRLRNVCMTQLINRKINYINVSICRMDIDGTTKIGTAKQIDN